METKWIETKWIDSRLPKVPLWFRLRRWLAFKFGVPYSVKGIGVPYENPHIVFHESWRVLITRSHYKRGGKIKYDLEKESVSGPFSIVARTSRP